MTREANIPIFLWIATAVLLHLCSGGGAQAVSIAIDEQEQVARFTGSVRSWITDSTRSVPSELEIEVGPSEPKELAKETEPSESGKVGDPTDAPEEAVPLERKPAEPPKPKAEQKPEEKEPPKEKTPPKEPPLVLPTPPLLTPPAPKPPEQKPPEPIPEKDQRVAVRQHVEDKNQPDNPDAKQLGEHANKVAKETQAKITGADADDPKPTAAGGKAAPNAKEEGTDDPDRVAHSEDKAGSKQAPGDAQRTDGKNARPAMPNPADAGAGTRGAADGAQSPRAAEKAQTPETGSKAQVGAPEVATGPGGEDRVARAQREQESRRGQAAKSGRRAERALGAAGLPKGPLFGLGAGGTIGNGINPNLSPFMAEQIVGADRLRSEIIADGERRKSARRGKPFENKWQKWRHAIENYVASVQKGNQTALNTKRAPFAGYLAGIHNRLHLIFADEFLSSLDSLPPSHPLQSMDLFTTVELAIRPSDGTIAKMGVIRTSGFSAYDASALDSLHRAQPFGPAPSVIASPDGLVYLHWRFHRNPIYACSTAFAEMIMLKDKPAEAPAELPFFVPRRAGGAERPRPPVPRGPGDGPAQRR